MEIDAYDNTAAVKSQSHLKCHQERMWSFSQTASAVTTSSMKIVVPAGQELHMIMSIQTTTAGVVLMARNPDTLVAAGAILVANKKVMSTKTIPTGATFNSGTAAMTVGAGTSLCTVGVAANIVSVLGDPTFDGSEFILGPGTYGIVATIASGVCTMTGEGYFTTPKAA